MFCPWSLVFFTDHFPESVSRSSARAARCRNKAPTQITRSRCFIGCAGLVLPDNPITRFASQDKEPGRVRWQGSRCDVTVGVQRTERGFVEVQLPHLLR